MAKHMVAWGLGILGRREVLRAIIEKANRSNNELKLKMLGLEFSARGSFAISAAVIVVLAAIATKGLGWW